MDMYGFYTGQVFDAHEYLGAHITPGGVVFRTFAPNAAYVTLLLNGRQIPMNRVYDGNFHEATVLEAGPGDTYEYRVYFPMGGFCDHCDPYGFRMEQRPNHKSIVCDLSAYRFKDSAWMKKRNSCLDKPLNIYELHLGSWRRKENGDWYSYAETARALIPYLKESGYNYVEVLPISEHPCDESWGYQNTGFFAPTSRYGQPADLMEMIDLLHQNGIGVILLIAEDSTNYPGVTHPIEKNGLGFDYKWDMGWMHDTLEYFQLPPSQRTKHYHKLTFSMLYFRNEQYLLPFSHDEVVHGKATILQKMNGQYEEKFPQARAMYLYMMVHPGKKMNFMGGEIGQLREWDEKRQQDWDLRKYPAHDSFSRFMQDLNRIYLRSSALWAWDYKEEGFQWLDCHQEEKCIYVISRTHQKSELVALFNLGSQSQTYALPPEAAKYHYRVLLHTDWECYGGKTRRTQAVDPSAVILPPFSGILLELI